MNSIILTRLGTYALITMAAMIGLVMPTPVVQAMDSGVQCMPNNLQQALNSPIVWDRFRVRNLHDTNPRFVLCPLDNDLDQTDTTTQYDIQDGTVNIRAWFGSASATNAEVFCVISESIDGGTPASGDSVTMTIQADDSLPDVHDVSRTLSGFTFASPAVASCRLDPHTGIQGVGVLNTP